MLTTRPRGTNDFLPGEIEFWQQLEEIIRTLFDVYNYKEIRTPIFEHTELFLRSVGESSDIVEKEMYSFEDKGLRHITLRPEGTASTVRAFLENRLFAEALPQKLYYIGPMFRYDQPQAGRYRQFHQFGCEVLGSHEAIIDAEVIGYAMTLFKKLGLKDLVVSLNTVGCDCCRPGFEEALYSYFVGYREELCETCLSRLTKNPLRILDCKEKRCSEIAASAPTTLDYACDSCLEHFSKVKLYLDEIDVAYKVDTSLVRGLDYYTQTAFEVMTTGATGQQSAICGGGRYNKLVAECGGEDIPGIGFASGMERLLLELKVQGIDISERSYPEVYFAPLDAASRIICFRFCQQLRELGVAAEIDGMAKSLKAQMKTANRLQARFAVIIGENEIENNCATVRDLVTSEQEEVMIEQLLDYLEERISNAPAEKNT